MQITVVNENEDTVRLSLKDVNTTVIEAIIDGLNKDANVVYARYIVDHPDLTDPMLEIKMAKGSSKDALLKASKAFEEYFKSVQTA
jgi:DNA-directed RNA polymerase subunit L